MKLVLKATVAAVALMSFAGIAHAEGDAAKGEKVFKKCKACHMVGDKAKKRVGPPLNNIIDAKLGAFEGFKYSKALKAKADEGTTWTVENLHAYLEKPKKFIPKGKMAFPGLKKEKDRNDVIAYLKQFSKTE